MKRYPIPLSRDEEVLAVVRRSALMWLPRIIVALIWLLIPFLFFFPLIQLDWIGIVIIAALLLSGIINAVRLIRQSRSMLIVTDRRVVDIHEESLFGRTVTEVHCKNIQDISFIRRGILRTIFDIGDVDVTTAPGHEYDIHLPGVRRPQVVCDLLHEVQYLHERSRT